MTIQSISEEVRRIQKKYGESDPFRLAQAMKIIVVLKPMGRYKGCCKGFYVQHRRIKHITINSDLPEVIQRVILAHEIAHSVLHTNITLRFMNLHYLTIQIGRNMKQISLLPNCWYPMTAY